MRVCLIAPVPPFRGGIAKYCYSLAQELEKRHELLLLSYQRQYPKLLYGAKSQIDPAVDRGELLKEFSRLSYTLDSANPLSWLATSRQITAFRPDLVLLPWWVAYWAPLYLYLVRSLKRQRIKVVFLCINVFEHEHSLLKNFLTRLVLKRADYLIVHSEQERRQILSFNPQAIVKRQLLPLFGYDAQPAPGSGARLKLLFFGFVRPYKGLDTLLRAMGILKNQGVSLTIAGEFWNDKDRYLRLIGELGVCDAVEIVDRYLSDAEMGRYFGETDLVVLPYQRSVTSGVIATAYGFGKPVLATEVGGFHEVVEDGATGKLVAPDDPQALAAGITWFRDHQEIDFKGNIERFAARNMSWQSLVDLIEDLG